MQRYHHLRFLGNRDRYLTRVHWAEYELLRTQIVFWASWLKTDRVDYRRTDNPGSITSGLCLATISQSPGYSCLSYKLHFPGFIRAFLVASNFCIEGITTTILAHRALRYLGL
jgi:hypothetical protein